MVVNKLQRGFSWDSYIRSAGTNSNNSNWPYNERNAASDAVTITEPLVEWKNTFNMRQVTLENIAECVNDHSGTKHAIKAAKMHGRNVVNAAKSLDLLRQNIQFAINNDIDRVIKKYLDMYFVPAISNIRNNLGHGSVNEEHVRELCRTMLDEAKHLYLNSPLSRSDSPFNAALDTCALIESRFGNSQDDHDEDKRLFTSVNREETDLSNALSSQLLAHKRKAMVNSSSCTSKNDPARIHSKTLFIMSWRVNKVLGCGGIRGKLFAKHPDLFRYCVDAEDRDWLIKHKLHYMSQNSSGSSYILVLEDIRDLLNSDYYRLFPSILQKPLTPYIIYVVLEPHQQDKIIPSSINVLRNNPNVLRHELKGFEAPEFMLKKMRSSIIVPENVTVVNHNGCEANLTVTDSSMACTSSDANLTSSPLQVDANAASGVIQATNVLIQVKEKKKVQKSNWTEDAMQKALRLISRGRSQRYVERKFGIPRRTLRNRLKIAASSRKNS